MNLNTETEERQQGVPKDASLPSVVAVIVNWNGKEHLLECLASIEALDYPDSKLKIVLVDNASRDGSQQAVTSLYPHCVLLENKKNLGYARAVNQGIQYGLASAARYLWIFNNDVVVFPDTLRELVNAGQSDDSIGVIAPAIYSYNDPDRVTNVGYSIDFWTGRMKRLRSSRDVFVNQEDTACDVDSVLGCSSLIKASVFDRIGLFRPIYNVYFEETDFNVRARRANFRVVIMKNAKVLHKDAATMDCYLLRRAWLLLRNLFLFECLNARRIQLLVFLPYYFLVHLPQFVVRGSFYALRVKYNQARNMFRGTRLFKKVKSGDFLDV
ncbi:glycosyltransferase family 2 protein [Petrachloros mirabilis]